MDIEKLAKDSKIDIFEHEKKAILERINTKLEIMDKIKDLSEEEFCPSFYSEELRCDEIHPSSSSDEVFFNASRKSENCFVVPRVVK